MYRQYKAFKRQPALFKCRKDRKYIFQTWKARNAAKSLRFFSLLKREQEHEKGKKSFRFFYNYDAFVIWVFLLWLVEKVAKQFVWKSCHLQEKQERSNRDFSVFCQGKCGPTHLLSHEKNLSSKIVSLTVYLGCKTRVTHCYTYRSLT